MFLMETFSQLETLCSEVLLIDLQAGVVSLFFVFCFW